MFIILRNILQKRVAESCKALRILLRNSLSSDHMIQGKSMKEYLVYLLVQTVGERERMSQRHKRADCMNKLDHNWGGFRCNSPTNQLARKHELNDNTRMFYNYGAVFKLHEYSNYQPFSLCYCSYNWDHFNPFLIA